MNHLKHLDWPFFEDPHRALASELDGWCRRNLAHGAVDHDDVDASCKALVKALGAGGWLQHAVAGEGEAIDTRAICLLRETLARYDGLADFAFAMQGLGSGAISLMGTPAQREAYLPRVARGEALAAFALSEPDAGSDVAAHCMAATTMSSTARRPGSPTGGSPTSTSSSRARARRPVRAASARSSSTPARRASRSPSGST